MENPYKPPQTITPEQTRPATFQVRQGNLVHLTICTVLGAVASLILLHLVVEQWLRLAWQTHYEMRWSLYALGGGGLCGAVLYKIAFIAWSESTSPTSDESSMN